ncbi:MAG: hypothetical protein Q8O10_05775 [candidate division Zixibacteria bacterium]|nr:hypothetical protein [candidate division Zixibacteria bacterium]
MTLERVGSRRLYVCVAILPAIDTQAEACGYLLQQQPHNVSLKMDGNQSINLN